MPTTTTTAQTVDPVAHDTAYLTHLRTEAVAAQAVHYAAEALWRIAGYHTEDGRNARHGRFDPAGEPGPTFAVAVAALRTELAGGEWQESRPARPCYRVWCSEREAVEALDKHDAARDVLAAAAVVVSADEAVYALHRWRRFFLVVSSDGLIHDSMSCSTCNKGRYSTGFTLVPSLSGADVEAAVTKLGPALCSVCYPAAPVEWLEAVRISARLALVLAEEGEGAFDAARAVAAAAKAKRDVGKCAGSGSYATAIDWRYRSPVGVCPTCSSRVSVTSTGKARQHKGSAE